jgi:hypothetical protein
MNESVKVYEELSVKVSPVVRRAEAIQVSNEAEYDQAALFLTEVKAKQDEVEAERVKVSKPMNEALRAHNDLFKRLSVPLETANRAIKGKMATYFGEQQRIREEAERKARDAARKQEEAERERLQKQAAAAAAKGRVERAEELKQMAAAVYVEPVPVAMATETTVVAGSGSVTMRNDIEVEIVNPYDLLLAIMNDELPLDWIRWDLQAIKRRAKADGLRAGSDRIAGVRIKPAIIGAVKARIA